MSFHLFISSSILFTSWMKFICVYFILFDTIVSRIVFLHSLIILYVYIEKQGSCLLILYPTA